MSEEYLRFPGYFSVREAAAILGYKEDRIWYYIRLQRLISRKIDGRSMITEESVRAFRIKPRGRVRAQTPPWQVYRGGAKVYTAHIDVQVRCGQQGALHTKLWELMEEQEHLFWGTMQRSILLDTENPSLVTIELVWKDTELTNEATLWHHLNAFQVDFAEIFEWETAQYRTKQAVIYTRFPS